MFDDLDGVVYQKTISLVRSNSGSSFWNWLFKRIQRKTSMVLFDLPMYYNATVKVRIKRPGAIARCGVMMLGTVLKYDYTKWGVSINYKDFSTTTFDRDGVATTTENPWATNMSLDLSIDNSQIKSAWDELMGSGQPQECKFGLANTRSPTSPPDAGTPCRG